MNQTNRRNCMGKDDSERWGSMSDLWVIFELPAEENKEDGEDGVGDDDDNDNDTISVLDQSIVSDSLSLGSSSAHGEGPRPLMKGPTKIHPCKRIDRNSLRSLGGSTKESSLRSLSSSLPESPTFCADELDLTEHSNDEGDCNTVDSSSVVYFSGDRWSPCVSPKKKVHNVSGVAAIPSLDKDEESSSSLPVVKLDQSPRVPRRMPVISMNGEDQGGPDCLPRLPLRSRAA
mmetsp:Transcript_288/g.596  ORF Transcript_288/g.596 Transcript_288/m.596 type:complete len:231 (-) Transcript_288:34-726(-)